MIFSGRSTAVVGAVGGHENQPSDSPFKVGGGPFFAAPRDFFLPSRMGNSNFSLKTKSGFQKKHTLR